MLPYRYRITPALLRTIKSITKVIIELNGQHFSNLVLAQLEHEALETSSHTSTSIEGNPLPLTEVKRLLKQRPNQLRTFEREVVNYNDTLIWLNAQLEKTEPSINLNFLLEVHKRVMKGLLPSSQLGKFRNEPVFVNDPRLRKTVYWPPDQKDVRSLLEALILFLKSSMRDLDPIILAGIFHKQFVIIHPFIDGNGRTVRLVTKSILAHLGIDTFSLFSFENFYNNNVTNYFSKVGVRGNYYDLKIDMTEWLEYFAEGILDELFRVQKTLQREVSSERTPETVLSSDQQKILVFISKNGFIKDSDYAKLTKRAKATRTLDFNKLIQLKLIQRFGKGKSTYYKKK